MLIYLPCVSALITFYVFSSKGIDYRAVAIGSLMPFLVDILIGNSSFGHSFVFPVLALVVVMIVTVGRTRMLRRRLLCFVIGIFLALVLEGAFFYESTWWWPTNFNDSKESFTLLPSLNFWIIRDAIGFVSFYLLFSIGELYKTERRNEFFGTGRIFSTEGGSSDTTKAIDN